jgi:hypothetical protein
MWEVVYGNVVQERKEAQREGVIMGGTAGAQHD